MKNKKPLYYDVYLLWDNYSFPEAEWLEFLKAFNLNLYNKRTTRECPIWYSITGKGYTLWVSGVHLWLHDGTKFWRIIISCVENTNVDGIILQYLIPYLAIQRWPQFTILMPNSGYNVYKASDYLSIAKQDLVCRVGESELLKHGFLNQSGDIVLRLL